MEDWKEFRTAKDLARARPKRRRVPVVLVVATALFFGTLLARLLKPHVVEALAYAKAVLVPRPTDLRVPHSIDSKKWSRRPHGRRREPIPEPKSRRAPALGPFDVYVLNGDRYIRVEGMSKYGILDTRTGKIVWIKKPR